MVSALVAIHVELRVATVILKNAKHRNYLCLSTVPFKRGPPFNYNDLVTRSPHALYTLALQHIVTQLAGSVYIYFYVASKAIQKLFFQETADFQCCRVVVLKTSAEAQLTQKHGKHTSHSVEKLQLIELSKLMKRLSRLFIVSNSL